MRLAIIIEGTQNSGKTSTIKELIKLFGFKNLKQMKAGWQQIFLNPIFKSLRIVFYCIPASPSETDIPLSKRFEEWQHLPEMLILAEQVGGQHHGSTMAFLNANHYHIKVFSINNSNGVNHWERFDNLTKNVKLSKRAYDITDFIKSFLKTNSIV
ncbi:MULTISPECIES: hypothetical protein [Flavobacterium]|uniref:hypothetical protein n=1 Tax=Flavobacterium TaxID=237 RepID=UPI0006FA7197|nr:MULTISPECIES: hypothetical protein [Flavobacterium]KRB56936.1 hypothetical protein ASD98_09670 [Flavobacterium sp. Root186]UUF16892.1 hypothetical protein NLJ00_12400 [Flavobacterium panici]